VNNEQEALIQYQKAEHQYNRFLQNRGRGIDISRGGVGQMSENSLYGENTARGVIMVALSAEKVGNILHANDEVSRIIGFNRKELIDKNVSIIQPPIFNQVHDIFLKRFLETARRSVLNHNRAILAISRDGYLKPIHSIIKLYPQITDKIITVGFI
jgi:PAS domain S-box-containing protein